MDDEFESKKSHNQFSQSINPILMDDVDFEKMIASNKVFW